MVMSESGANVMAGPVGNSPGPETTASVTGGELLNAPARLVHDLDDELGVLRAIHGFQRGRVGGELQRGGRAADGPFRRRNVKVFVAIPIPHAFRQAEVVHHPHRAEALAGNAAMIESAPERFAAAPRITPEKRLRPVPRTRHQVAPARLVIAGPAGHRRAVFGDHIGDAGIDEEPRAVAVVAGDVAELVKVARAGSRRWPPAGWGPGHANTPPVPSETSVPWAAWTGGEKHFIVHAPNDDAGMVAVDADHVAQAVPAHLLQTAADLPASAGRRCCPRDS